MVQLILADGDHTFDASLKTITLAAPYTALSEGQILKIVNLTVKEVLYDTVTRQYPISISGAVITYTYDNTYHNDTDLLQVIIDTGSAALPIFVNVNNDAEVATTPVIYNVTMTALNTEYSQELPANTKIISFRCQDSGFAVRYAFEIGKVAASVSPYRNLLAGEERTVEGLNLTSKTLYFACSTAAKVMELEVWV